VIHQRRHAAAPLTVHCQFGQSRSVAVGIFLAAWLDRQVLLAHDVLAPNPWVLRQLRRAALPCALRWRDWRLLAVALTGPLAPRFRYRMMGYSSFLCEIWRFDPENPCLSMT
jgi:hypothetical protein